MKTACFLDTNVLIYAARGRTDDPPKHAIAVGIIETANFGLSGHVLAEFVHNARKSIRGGEPLPDSEIERWLAMLSAFPVVGVDADIVRAGFAHARRYKISYWDGAIIAAAERLGASILYTEDLKSGQTYGSVRAVNPFAATQTTARP